MPPPTPEARLAWITGSGGLIGHALVESAPRFAPHWRILDLPRSRVDLTDFAAVDRLAATHPPHLIIHCAALSRSPACQEDPALARRINVEATAHLHHMAGNMPFVFFSTDLVFDGRHGGYVETDAVHPLSVYGETKAEAEAIVLRNPLHTVIRTSLTGGRSPTGDRGFNEDMQRAWAQGRSLRLFTDEFRCPLPARVTAQAVWKVLRVGATGLYHLAGRDRLSRYEIGELVAARHPHLHPRIEAASLTEYEGPPRPADCSLDCTKIQALLPFSLPGLRDWLATHPHEPF